MSKNYCPRYDYPYANIIDNNNIGCYNSNANFNDINKKQVRNVYLVIIM